MDSVGAGGLHALLCHRVGSPAALRSGGGSG